MSVAHFCFFWVGKVFVYMGKSDVYMQRIHGEGGKEKKKERENRA